MSETPEEEPGFETPEERRRRAEPGAPSGNVAQPAVPAAPGTGAAIGSFGSKGMFEGLTDAAAAATAPPAAQQAAARAGTAAAPPAAAAPQLQGDYDPEYTAWVEQQAVDRQEEDVRARYDQMVANFDPGADPGLGGTPPSFEWWAQNQRRPLEEFRTTPTVPAPVAEAAPPAESEAIFNPYATPQFQAGGRGRIPMADVQQEEGRQAQQQLQNILYQGALGGGPSAAQDLLAGQREQALRQQQQAGAVGGAAGLRGAQMEMGDIEGRLGREAAMRQAQEQQFAQQMLGQVTGQMRTQDLGAATGLGGLLDTGAARDDAAAATLADAFMGVGAGELQEAAQVTTAETAQAQFELSTQQMEQLAIHNLNQTELRAVQLKLEGMKPIDRPSMISALAGMGTQAVKAWAGMP